MSFAGVSVRLTKYDARELETGFSTLSIQSKRATDAMFAVHDVGADFGTSSAGTHGNLPLREQKLQSA